MGKGPITMFVIAYLMAMAVMVAALLVVGIGAGLSGWSMLLWFVGLSIAAQILIVLYVALHAITVRGRPLGTSLRKISGLSFGQGSCRWEPQLRGDAPSARHGRHP
jgi:hypothetical protein